MPAKGALADGDMMSSKQTPMSTEDFWDVVRRSKLVDEGKRKALLQSMRQRSGVDASAIAQSLVQAKLLTPWQTEKLLAGQVDHFFLGRYKLLSALGSGAMGSIFLAEHVRMRRRAAVKILPRRFVEDAKRLELFYREAEATAALDHPNVVRAYDVDNEGETYYLVMEYVEGANLDQIVTREGPLHYARAAEYVRQVADGLSHAHERGIIHRDVKPANLMLDSKDRVKILDMGLSQWEQVEASPSESPESLSGTPDFFAPELASGSTQGNARSDIYSLGCTFFFLLTGQPPFSASSIPALLREHERTPPPMLCEFVPEFPEELDAIYQRMMAKRPEDRFSSTREICTAIADWQSTVDTPAPSSESRAPETPSGEAPTVLVAEDDEVTRQMLCLQLQKAGFEVRVAGDGQEAMDMMDADVTVCLFDLNMPRATGMDCLRHVHSHFPETPVIILTASDEVQDAIAAMREGAFDYLNKPCRITNVLTRVDEALRMRTRSAQDDASLDSLMQAGEKQVRATMETLVMDDTQGGDASLKPRRPQ